ncbi:MAG: GNAT family protein [Bacteroidota bacterium]
MITQVNKYYLPLKNDTISLLPLQAEHIEEMRELSSGSDIWKWYTSDLSDPNDLSTWMHGRLKESRQGDKMSYAVLLNSSGSVIGSTSFGHIDWDEKCVEVGWTWLGQDYIGTGINKQMKFLMLRHAFEIMDIERLELRTDELNVRSRRAMEKIGAQYDGILRNHRSTRGGRRRNTVIYSIIRSEWKELSQTIFKDL